MSFWSRSTKSTSCGSFWCHFSCCFCCTRRDDCVLMSILGMRTACCGAFVGQICLSQWVEPSRNRAKNRPWWVHLLSFSLNKAQICSGEAFLRACRVAGNHVVVLGQSKWCPAGSSTCRVWDLGGVSCCSSIHLPASSTWTLEGRVRANRMFGQLLETGFVLQRLWLASGQLHTCVRTLRANQKKAMSWQASFVRDKNRLCAELLFSHFVSWTGGTQVISIAFVPPGAASRPNCWLWAGSC